MKACAIIVGFDYWYETHKKDSAFTHRFVHQLRDANPDLKVLVIDNFSSKPYASDTIEILRTNERIGYGAALNMGLKHLQKDDYDWYICLNNDCIIDADGNVFPVLSLLDPDTVYGSGKNEDYKLKITWQWSAWLCISRKVLKAVGYFDEQLTAAFEDFDYQKRATDLGFKLAEAKLPIIHLDKHTRMDIGEKLYAPKWEAARLYFEQKHGLEMDRWFKV